MSITRTSTGLSTGKKVAIGIVVMIVVILLGLFLWVTNVEKAAPEFSYKTIEPNDFVGTILNTTKYNATTKNLTLTLSHNLINSYMEQMRLETTAELPSYMSIEGMWLNLYNSRLYVKVKIIGITTTLTIPIEAESVGNSIRITWDRIYLKRVSIAKFITDGLLGDFKSYLLPLNQMGLDNGMKLESAIMGPGGIKIETSINGSVYVNVLEYRQDHVLDWLSRYAQREPDKAYIYDMALEVFGGEYTVRTKLFELSEEVYAIEQLGNDLMYTYIEYIRNEGR